MEEIGLRSTRLRLLTGHLVTVPNDALSRNDIENVARRPYIRRVTDLQIPLNTPSEKLETALAILRDALEGHEGHNPEFPPRVYFSEFNGDALNVRVMYWYHPADYWAYMDFSERLNLQILAALESQGIPLTQPLRVSHTSLRQRGRAAWRAGCRAGSCRHAGRLADFLLVDPAHHLAELLADLFDLVRAARGGGSP